MKEQARVRPVKFGLGDFWVVEILSAATGTWICQGVHLTKFDAEEDLKNWL